MQSRIHEQDLEIDVGLPVWLFPVALDISLRVVGRPDKGGLRRVGRILNVAREANISLKDTGRKPLFADTRASPTSAVGAPPTALPPPSYTALPTAPSWHR
jgi:hypothetical protein